jgi:hypothetical protein
MELQSLKGLGDYLPNRVDIPPPVIYWPLNPWPINPKGSEMVESSTTLDPLELSTNQQKTPSHRGERCDVTHIFWAWRMLDKPSLSL